MLSESNNTSVDSRDIKRKLIFSRENNFESSEFIGIERGDTFRTQQDPQLKKSFNRSFEKKKYSSKSSLKFGKKKKSQRSVSKNRKPQNLNKSKNHLKSNLSKLKLSEINQSLLLNGKEKSFLDKFESTKK